MCAVKDRWIETLLEKDEMLGRTRCTRAFPSCGAYVGVQQLNLASNDYLGLARDTRILQAGINAATQFGASSAASRVVCGTTPLHEEFESELARFVGMEASLVFSSGYAANAGLLSATLSRHDTVFIDRLAHASLLDGVRLTGARMVRFAHNDLDELGRLLDQDRKKLRTSSDTSRRFIITESVFSMDGDLSPVSDLLALAEQFEAHVIVDEAHSLGVFGDGRGSVAEAKCLDRVFAITGTLGKSFGSHGGVVLGSQALVSLMRNRARTLLFDTALAPFHLGAAMEALKIVRANPDQGRTLLAKSTQFSVQLRRLIPFCMEPASQIVPIILGDPRLVTDVRDALMTAGVIVAAIRQPTVPAGTDRIRLSVSLCHDDQDLQRAAEQIAQTVDRYTRNIDPSSLSNARAAHE